MEDLTPGPRDAAAAPSDGKPLPNCCSTAGETTQARLTSEASFAALCGPVSLLPASLGKTIRHRLNRGGDRAANSSAAHHRRLPDGSIPPRQRGEGTP